MANGSFSLNSLYLAVTILLGLLTLAAYVFDYRPEKFDDVSKQAELKRWEKACDEFGELVSDIYTSIDDDPNIFEEVLEDPEDAGDFIKDSFDEGTEFERLETLLHEVKEPKKYATRCWIGSFFSPFAYGAAAGLLIPGILISNNTISNSFRVASVVVFAIAFILTFLYIYYRILLRRFETSQTFMS